MTQTTQNEDGLLSMERVIALDNKIFPKKLRSIETARNPEALVPTQMLRGLTILKNLLERINRIYLTTHEYPDPDGLGSEIGLYYILKQMGIEVFFANPEPSPEKYDFLDPENILNPIQEDFTWKELSTSLIILLDSNSFDRTGWLYRKMAAKIPRIFIIDHHTCSSELISKNLVYQEISSTGELIYNIGRYFNITLNDNIARAIYAAIVSDTGGFRYPSTSAKTHEIAADLIKKNVDSNEVYSRIFLNFRPGRVLLMSPALQSLKLKFNNRLAVIDIKKEDLKRFNVNAEDTDNIVNIPLQYEGIDVCLFFREEDDGQIKVSIRSNSDIDVASIARLFNGGGHKNAAGTKIKTKKEKKLLIDTIGKEFDI